MAIRLSTLDDLGISVDSDGSTVLSKPIRMSSNFEISQGDKLIRLQPSLDGTRLDMRSYQVTGNSVSEQPRPTVDFTRVLVDDGNVSTPSYSFSNDSNTGMFAPGSDILALTTGGVQQVTLSNDMVGIGVASPIEKLHVNGNVYSTGSYWTNNNLGRKYVMWQNANVSHESEFYGLSLQNGTFKFNIDIDNSKFVFNISETETELMRIQGDGKVGIGVTNPAYKLHVNGEIYSTDNITSFGTNTTSDIRIKTDLVEIDPTVASDTLKKLRPLTYVKRNIMDLSVQEIDLKSCVESGFVAQEIYAVPELRHLVNLSTDADTVSIDADPVGSDPSLWGSAPASVRYDGLLAFVVAALQAKEVEIAELRARLDSAGL